MASGGMNVRRRGSTYVVILGVAMTVTAIGLGSIAVSRVQTRSVTRSNEWSEAKMLAFSSVEHAMYQINNTADWRTNLSGVAVQRSLGNGAFSWQVVDPVDGDLANNASDPATLIATGTVNDATYTLTIKLQTPGQAPGSGANTALWGINEDNGVLFSVEDYTEQSPNVTVYGPLYWDNNGTDTQINSGIQGFSIDIDGTAYMVSTLNVGAYSGPVLMRFNVGTASTTSNNVVQIVGAINWAGGPITGLAIDPSSGNLYALGRQSGWGNIDHLLLIDRSTAEVTTDIGAMEGQGTFVAEGEGMTFDGSSGLYVTDPQDECVHKINIETGAIIQVVDNDTVPNANLKLQALAWDAVNNRLIGTQANSKKLMHITLQNGNNTEYGSLGPAGLNDVEALGFLPPGGSSNNVQAIQLPNAIDRQVN